LDPDFSIRDGGIEERHEVFRVVTLLNLIGGGPFD